MKMYLISDNIDTWTGMRLAGVDGAVVHERDELKRLMAGLVMMLLVICFLSTRLWSIQIQGNIMNPTSQLLEFLEDQGISYGMNKKKIHCHALAEAMRREFPEIIDNVKLERKLPLIVEIPDRHGTGRKPDFITSYVNEAIGLKL